MCGRFCLNGGRRNRLRQLNEGKFKNANWGVQIAGMIFQTCSKI
ncbi:DUF6783 domain-containing protein [Anaerobutyricum hallii]